MSIQAKYAIFGVMFAITAGLVAYLYATADQQAAWQSAAVLAAGVTGAFASRRGRRCGWFCGRRRESEGAPDGVV